MTGALTDVELEVEQGVLGSCLCSANAVEIAVAACSPPMFWRAAHREIFTSIVRLSIRGASVDLLSLKADLGPKLDEAGGVDYLFQIAESVPSAANVQTYCDLLIRSHLRREVRKRAVHVVGLCDRQEDPEKILSEASELTRGLARPGSWARDAASIVGSLRTGAGAVQSVPSGWSTLDLATGCGGWPSGQVSIVSAFRKGGKTSMMVGSALSRVLESERVCYATFADLSGEQIVAKACKQIMGWDKEPRFRDDLRREWESALTTIEDSRLVVYDPRKRRGAQSVEAFSAWALAEHDGNPWDVLFVDYIQRMSTDEKFAQGTPTTRVTAVSEALNRLAGALGVPVVVGSQITKGEGGDVKTKDARAIEEDAGLLLRIEGERSDSRQPVDLKIVANRFGAGGKVVRLMWDPQLTKFQEHLGGQ